MEEQDFLAAIGVRAHSGWAALVAVAGTRRSIRVVARRRIEIADPEIRGSKQPYHEAEGMPVEEAAKFLEGCEKGAERLARKAFEELLEELARSAKSPRACGLLLASGRPLPELGAILASHALIHTADGEHFREAVSRACAKCRLPVVRVRMREVLDRASAVLGVPAARLSSEVNELGRSLGPPWTQDQKLAALAAWLAGASAANTGSRSPAKV